MRRLLPVWGTSLLVVLMAATASAAPPAKKAPRAKKPAAPALAPPEMDRNSSRFILPESQEEYIERILGRMSMTKRVNDPFGRNQDPNAVPDVVEKTEKGPKGPIKTPTKKATLQEALGNLKITTVMPAEGRFLADGRSFQKGESTVFKLRGKNITLQVMDVRASEITFRNAETGEIATIKMKLLPPGMQPGTTLSEAPGLFRSKKDEPINLDATGNP